MGKLARWWPLALPLLLFLPHLNDFLYLPGAAYSDLTISHYPNFYYLREALIQYHTIPLWSPAILSGFPFFADPLSGLWYPPGWLPLLAPEPWAYNLTAGLHLIWGGLGLAYFLRKTGLRRQAALAGALAFALMPKLYGHFAAGHITLVYAVCWTPWLLVVSGVRHQVSGETSRYGGGKWYAQPAVLLPLIFFADPRWAAYAGVLWLVYTFTLSSRPNYKLPITNFLLALGLSAPLLIPLIEYTALSTRARLIPDDVLAFSLPPARLLGLLFPDISAAPEWVIYPGAVVLVLALAALIAKRDGAKFWGWVALGALVFSLGENIPVLRLWAYIPGANLLRVPPRAMFVFGLALAVLAAMGLDALLAGLAPAARRRVNRLAVAMAGSWLAITAGVWWLARDASGNFLIGALFGLLAVAALFLSQKPPSVRQSPITHLPITLLLITNLLFVNASLLSPRPREEIYAQGAEAAQWLAAQPGEFRVYSPSYSIPQHTAARYGLHLADGVDPLQLRAYVEFMEQATGIPNDGYSVTLPPFKGDVRTANAGFVPDAGLLRILNIRYVVADFQVLGDYLLPVAQFGMTRIYENLAVFSPAWIQEPPTSGEYISYGVENAQIFPNRIVAYVDRPGIFIVAQPFYPGWYAEIDGLSQPTIEKLGFLAVRIPGSAGMVTFLFRPISLYAGLVIGMISLLAAFVFFRDRK